MPSAKRSLTPTRQSVGSSTPPYASVGSCIASPRTSSASSSGPEPLELTSSAGVMSLPCAAKDEPPQLAAFPPNGVSPCPARRKPVSLVGTDLHDAPSPTSRCELCSQTLPSAMTVCQVCWFSKWEATVLLSHMGAKRQRGAEPIPGEPVASIGLCAIG